MDAKAAAKRKAEEERIAKLSPAEQKKVINWIHVTAYLNSGYFLIQELEKERRRQLRKSQSKVVRKWYHDTN